jgi:hypothetical protein
MKITPIAPEATTSIANRPTLSKPSGAKGDDPQLRPTFDAFVGETLFGQMLKQMRKSVAKTPYCHGGRTEEVFQQQLDQVLAEKMSRSSADKLTGPMYELYTLNRM